MPVKTNVQIKSTAGCYAEADPEFGWQLGTAESMGHAPKMVHF